MSLAMDLIKLLTVARLLVLSVNSRHATGLSPFADIQNEREILRNLTMSRNATSTSKPLDNPQETIVKDKSSTITTFSTETSVAFTLQSTLDHITTTTLTTHSDNTLPNDDSSSHYFYVPIIITLVVSVALITIVTIVIFKVRRKEKKDCKVYYTNENCNTTVSVS